MTTATDVANAIRRVAQEAGKPILACLMGTHGVPAAAKVLREAKVPAYAFPEGAVLALTRAVRYGQWLQRREGSVPEFEHVSAERARAVLQRAATGWLSPEDTRAVLTAYGIRMPETRVVNTASDAVAAAGSLGYPVALKLVSRHVLHKTEVGGVFLNLSSAEDVRRAFESMRQSVEAHRAGEFEGAIVQEMVAGAVEAYVGMTRTPGFGALPGFGIGGINVELWKNVAVRVHPLTDADARDMLEQIRGKALLDGFGGLRPRTGMPRRDHSSCRSNGRRES